MVRSDLSRRTFLKLGAQVSALPIFAAGGAVTLAGCEEASRSEPQGYYPRLRSLRAGLQASPDHTPARAKAVIETRDANAIMRFVRDEIRLVSHNERRYGLGEQRRFGERAALRAGAGTAFEKASILRRLLQQAGFDARVVMTSSLPRNEVAGVFHRNFEQVFEPSIAEEEVRSWVNQPLDRTSRTYISDVAEDHDVPALRQSIKAALGGELSEVLARPIDPRQEGLTPVVEIAQADGSRVYADPIRLGRDVGPLPDGTRVSEPRGVDGTFPVRVTVSATTTADPEARIPLVSREWRSDQLAGRQLNIAFKPNQALGEVFASRVGELRLFAPVLSLQDVNGLEDLAPEDWGAVGDAITLEGDHIHADPQTGQVEVNGVPVRVQPVSAQADTVRSIEIVPNAATFPDMTLGVTPRDDAGEIVEGLTAADFVVEDEREHAPILLRASDPAVRVLILADASLSMPAAYRLTFEQNGEAIKALASGIEQRVKDLHPNAQVELQSTTSNLWEELDRAVAQKAPNLVIYASDGHVAGARPSQDGDMAARLRAGPPVIVLSCERPIADIRATARRRGESNVFDEMAELTGGRVLDALTDDVAPLETSIETFLRENYQPPAYTLSYRALASGTRERRVRVRAGSADTQEPYHVEAGAVGRATKLVSLRLAIEMDGIAVEQVLAGHDGLRGPPTQSDIDAVHGACLGKHMVAFEGCAPSLSVILDEIVAARMSLEDLDLAIASGADHAGLQSTLEAGFHTLDGRLAGLMGRPMALSGQDFSFAEQGLRAVLYSRHPVMNSAQIVERMDILPTARPGVVSAEQHVRQDRAFEHSLRLAAAEASLFQVSTLSLLKDRPLGVFERYTHRGLGLAEAQEQAWAELMERSLRPNHAGRHPGSIFLSDPLGQTRAVWAVDRGTGEIIGVLPDGSGGGFGPASDEEAQRAAEEIRRQLNELDQVLAGLNLLIGFVPLANPLGGASLGLIAAYGQQLARLYGAASLSLILADGQVAQLLAVRQAQNAALAGQEHSGCAVPLAQPNQLVVANVKVPTG